MSTGGGSRQVGDASSDVLGACKRKELSQSRLYAPAEAYGVYLPAGWFMNWVNFEPVTGRPEREGGRNQREDVSSKTATSPPDVASDLTHQRWRRLQQLGVRT